MPQEPEQIGDLTFVPNPNYPYPFPVKHPPHFWMTEQSGRLVETVERYFKGEPLTSEGLEHIKLYLRQYLERAVMSGEADRAALLRKLEKLRSNTDIERFVDELAEIGVEPF